MTDSSRTREHLEVLADALATPGEGRWTARKLATLAQDLQTLGFSATAYDLAAGRVTGPEALAHIQDRLPGAERALERPHRLGTVGEADRRRLAGWLDDARRVLSRYGVAA